MDHASVFVRRVVRLRSLVHRSGEWSKYSGVLSNLPPWVAEGELRVRKEGVEIVVGRHRSCCREMRILLVVTVMIARSSRAWRWLRIRCSTRAILWAMRTSGSRISPVCGLPWRWMSSPKVLVHGNEDPVLRRRPVPGVALSPGSGPSSLASRASCPCSLKPLCQPASCAAVHEEVHSYPTDTCARESPAMTAWA